MSVGIYFGAGLSVTKHLPLRAEIRVLGAVGTEIGTVIFAVRYLAITGLIPLVTPALHWPWDSGR
jgi:hypothetical protein